VGERKKFKKRKKSQFRMAQKNDRQEGRWGEGRTYPIMRTISPNTWNALNLPLFKDARMRRSEQGTNKKRRRIDVRDLEEHTSDDGDTTETHVLDVIEVTPVAHGDVGDDVDVRREVGQLQVSCYHVDDLQRVEESQRSSRRKRVRKKEEDGR
jgi:hypothetical protein